MTIDTPEPSSKRPGPVPTDIALLTRNRLWAWIVLACTPGVNSWPALDKYWLARLDGETPTPRTRRKVFPRYFYVGNDPGKLRGIKPGVERMILTDLVHRDPHQGAAAALYTSPFWQLTGAEAPTLDQVRAVHAQLLQRLGMVRLTPTERAVARSIGFVNVASDNQDLRTIAENAYNIGELPSVDTMALLACSFRLALDALSLKEAEVYLNALRWSLRRFLARWNAHHLVSQALATLIEVRLLRRPAGPVSPELLGFRIRRERRSTEPALAAERRLDDIAILLRGEAPYASPIAPMDDGMGEFFEDFEESCRMLRDEIVQRLSEGDAGPQLMDTSNVIRQQRCELVDNVLLGKLNSPDGDAVEMLRHIARFRALGGLTGILDEVFKPDVECLAGTQPGQCRLSHQIVIAGL